MYVAAVISMFLQAANKKKQAHLKVCWWGFFMVITDVTVSRHLLNRKRRECECSAISAPLKLTASPADNP